MHRTFCSSSAGQGSEDEVGGNSRQRHSRVGRDGEAAGSGSLEKRLEELEKVRVLGCYPPMRLCVKLRKSTSRPTVYFYVPSAVQQNSANLELSSPSVFEFHLHGRAKLYTAGGAEWTGSVPKSKP